MCRILYQTNYELASNFQQEEMKVFSLDNLRPKPTTYHILKVVGSVWQPAGGKWNVLSRVGEMDGEGILCVCVCVYV